MASYGYRYVLPVRFAYQADADEGHRRMKYPSSPSTAPATRPAIVAG